MKNLSKEKLNAFLGRIKISKMTSNHWQNAKHFISFVNTESRENIKNETKYVKQKNEIKVAFSGNLLHNMFLLTNDNYSIKY